MQNCKKRRTLLSALLGGFLAIAAPAQEPPKGFETVDQEIEVVTLKAQMKYDIETVYAKPGAKIKLTLKNPDDLPHNLVVAHPGKTNGKDKGSELADAVLTMGDEMVPSGFIPLKHPRLIAHTGLVNPGETKTIYFTVPEKKGNYPLVCTYPGHWSLMNALMIVGAKPPSNKGPLTDLKFKAYAGAFGKVEDITKIKPYKEGPLKKIDIAVAEKKTDFGMVFTGTFTAPVDGTYAFATSSDDGSVLLINGKKVVDNDGIHGAQRVEGKIKLTAGPHDLRVDYFERSGEESLYVGYRAPDATERSLSTQKSSAADGSGTGLPIIPPWGEASIYRNFILGAGPRAIGVGFAEAQNYAFNANSMNIPLMWRGAFIDGARHWRGRGQGFQPPSSEDIVQLELTEAPFAYLETPEATWPAGVEAGEPANRPLGFRFKGYELDAKRTPTFRYHFGDATVTDKLVPTPDGMTRHLHITDAQPSAETASKLYFSVGTLDGVGGEGRSFALGKRMAVTLPADGILRGNQLIVPVALTDGTASLELIYTWK